MANRSSRNDVLYNATPTRILRRTLKETNSRGRERGNTIPRFLSMWKGVYAGLVCLSVGALYLFMPEHQFYLKMAGNSDKRFVIFTRNCRVPDYGAWHPSVVPYVSTTKPEKCSDYPRYSYSSRTTLYINTSAMRTTEDRRPATPPINCCYRAIFRPPASIGNDSLIMNSTTCTPVTNGTLIPVEFIRLVCWDATRSLVYANYHAFVHPKPDVEARCNRLRPPRLENSPRAENRREFEYSVLLIGTDSQSRNNMKRSIPKTVRYLTASMNAIWMNGVNALGENTLDNVIPLLTGQHMHEVKNGCRPEETQFWDNCTFLWKLFADGGYRTLYAEDSGVISTFNYLKPGFKEQPTDYYSRPFILPFEHELGHNKPLNCYLCVGPSLVSEVVLNYTRDFAITFRNEPYFAFTWINSLTHDFASTRWAGDEVFYRFFQSLYSGGYLKRTIVVFLSDHGMRWGNIRRTFAGLLEGRLPGYLWYLPEHFRLRYPELVAAFEGNAYRLTTPLDAYATLRGVLEDFALLNASNMRPFTEATLAKYDGRKMSSLFTPVPLDRTCQDTGMEEPWCSCLRRSPTSTSGWPVPQVGAAIVHEVNRILEPYRDLCAHVTLLRVDTAYEHIVDDPGEANVFWFTRWLHRRSKHDLKEFTVSVITTPGNAVFEATARVFGNSVTLLGDVLRLSLYGNSSECVPRMPYRKFCHCVQQPAAGGPPGAPETQ